MKIHFQECKDPKEYTTRDKKKLQTRLMVNFKNTEGKEKSNNFQRGRDHLRRNKNQIDTRLLKTRFKRVIVIFEKKMAFI